MVGKIHGILGVTGQGGRVSEEVYHNIFLIILFWNPFSHYAFTVYICKRKVGIAGVFKLKNFALIGLSHLSQLAVNTFHDVGGVD